MVVFESLDEFRNGGRGSGAGHGPPVPTAQDVVDTHLSLTVEQRLNRPISAKRYAPI